MLLMTPSFACDANEDNVSSVEAKMTRVLFVSIMMALLGNTCSGTCSARNIVAKHVILGVRRYSGGDQWCAASSIRDLMKHWYVAIVTGLGTMSIPKYM